ncbi:MAG: hypothetical protein WAL04_13550 [Acidimicrobiales bacterium]
MDDDLDFTKMLDDGDRPAASPDVLRQVVARHRRRRARHYRLVATSAIVIALAGAGVGVGLNENGATHNAAGERPPSSGRAPAGLRWDSGIAVGAKTSVLAPAASDHGQPSTLTPELEVEPGEFGFAATSKAASSQGGPLRLPVPAATPTNAGGGYGYGIARGCKAGCGVLFNPLAPRALFTRHVDGITLTASLEPFAFPVVLRANGIPVSGAAPAGGSAPAPAPTPRSTGTTSKGVRPLLTPKPIPIEGICPVGSELVVTIAYKGTTETLFVPAGGPSTRPFSVVASAATQLPGAASIALAVAHTSAGVSTVSASFASGASDAMAPKDGWVVLAQVLPSSADLARAGTVTLVAKSSSGATLETVSLPASGALATAPALGLCRYLVQPVNAVGVVSPPAVGRAKAGATGSGSSSTSVGASVVAPSSRTTT